jgi:hypothetical protein
MKTFFFLRKIQQERDENFKWPNWFSRWIKWCPLGDLCTRVPLIQNKNYYVYNLLYLSELARYIYEILLNKIWDIHKNWVNYINSPKSITFLSIKLILKFSKVSFFYYFSPWRLKDIILVIQILLTYHFGP